MSDLEGLKFHLDGLVGDDPGYLEVEWAVAEITTLREKLAEAREELDHRCGKCGGSGAVVVDCDPDGRTYLDKCPDCDGRGSVIGGEDEEYL